MADVTAIVMVQEVLVLAKMDVAEIVVLVQLLAEAVVRQAVLDVIRHVQELVKQDAIHLVQELVKQVATVVVRQGVQVVLEAVLDAVDVLAVVLDVVEDVQVVIMHVLMQICRT